MHVLYIIIHTPVDVFRQILESVFTNIQTFQSVHAEDTDGNAGKFIFWQIQMLQFFQITQLKWNIENKNI